MTKIGQSSPRVEHSHNHGSVAQQPPCVTEAKKSPAQVNTTYEQKAQNVGVPGDVQAPKPAITRSLPGVSETISTQSRQRTAAPRTTSSLDNVRQGGQLLRNGSSGPQVNDLQQMLNAAGANPPLETDGKFGPLTQAAVRDFQGRQGISVDGVVGPQTMGSLDGNPQAGPTAPTGHGHDHGHAHPADPAGPAAPVGDVPQGTSTADAYDRGRNIGRIQVTTIDGKPVELRTATAFREMEAAAQRDGVDINIRSGFRSNEQQADLYRRYQNGTGNLAARPGYSNHQNGRALDLNTENAAVRNWLDQNGARFGFARTVPSEPWHWEHRH